MIPHYFLHNLPKEEKTGDWMKMSWTECSHIWDFRQAHNCHGNQELLDKSGSFLKGMEAYVLNTKSLIRQNVLWVIFRKTVGFFNGMWKWLGDMRKIHNLDNCLLHISAHKRERSMGSMSEGTFPIFMESKRKGGEKCFQTWKILSV